MCAVCAGAGLLDAVDGGAVAQRGEAGAGCGAGTLCRGVYGAGDAPVAALESVEVDALHGLGSLLVLGVD